MRPDATPRDDDLTVFSPEARTRTADGPAGATLHVLLVEDAAADAELLAALLDEVPPDGDPRLRIMHVERLADARRALDEMRIDVVLLDLSLPDGQGLDTLAAVLRAAPDVPVVVLTGLADDALALDAVRAGAQDYLVKGRVDGWGLRRSIRHAVERQRLVLAARHASRARDEVLAIVSHDLRDPLARISMAVDALLDPHPLSPDDARAMLEAIRRAARSTHRLIEDLLDVARLDANSLSIRLEPVPVAALLSAVASAYRLDAEGRGITLVTDVAAPLPRVSGDAERLQQALGNLVANAVRFTPRGGSVTLRAAPVDDGRAVRFAVIDTGCGIAPAQLPYVFDRFWQARTLRRGGAGLGLAIARGIVEAHGGTIAVDSAVGVGTTFTCVVPAIVGDGTDPAPR